MLSDCQSALKIIGRHAAKMRIHLHRRRLPAHYIPPNKPPGPSRHPTSSAPPACSDRDAPFRGLHHQVGSGPAASGGLAKTASGLAATAVGVTGARLGYSAWHSAAPGPSAVSPPEAPGPGSVVDTLPPFEGNQPLPPVDLGPLGGRPLLTGLPPLTTVVVGPPVPSTPVPEPSGALVLLPAVLVLVLTRGDVAARKRPSTRPPGAPNFGEQRGP
jgi:hypothetical protein